MAELDTLQRLRRGFSARGDLAALVAFTGEGEENWSFARLGEVSASFAGALAGRGIGRGDSVGLVAPNSPLWIAAFWGIIAAGAVAVPLDAQNEDRDLASMIATAGCRLLFVSAANAQRLRDLAPSCATIVLDRASESAAEGTSANFPAVEAADIALIVFTSGTTGTPKAVPLSHDNVLTNVRALAPLHLVGPGDRALLPLPLYHAYPIIIGMITPLALGCAVVLPAGVSGPELLAAMRRGRVTALVGVPRLYTALVDNMRRGIAARSRPMALLARNLLALAVWSFRHGLRWPGRMLLRPLRRQVAPDLRLLVSGGAAVEVEVEETLDAMGWELLSGYGLVETSSMLSFNPPGLALPGSAGRPVPGVTVRIADPDAAGEGEIEARGPSLFRGYRGDPGKTREAFTPDGWFRTGDLGSVDAKGYIHIAARKTETIVLADGKKLFPEAFEKAYGSAPLIHEIALLGVNGALVGLVVPDLAAARELGAERLGGALRDSLVAAANHLPSYARLSGFAVAHAPLPRTQLGKIRRHLLPALYEAARQHQAPAVEGELSPEDQALLEIPAAEAVRRWLAARFPDRGIGLDTILQLDLGIDSLGWVELTLALERDLGIVLGEREIARIVTLRDLLREAVSARSGAAAAPASGRAIWLTPLSPGLRILRAMGEFLIRLAMRYAFKLRVEGLDLLPPEDPILFCPNHVSYLDPFALGSALPHKRLKQTYWAGWTGVAFTTPLRRLFSRAARVLPIDPDRAAAYGLALGRGALAQGCNLVWFPEGSRSVDGTLQPFLPGIGAVIAARLAPIVPVYIAGSFAAWPVERHYPRLGRITVRFGKPIDPAPLLAASSGRGAEERIAAAVQAAVAALAD